ncbi:MAG: L,D-transpeptidase family protein [Burkholderiales bacterium]|nr:L,D-transpeptidase family protein [Burkholderiales bacterium]
MRRFSLRGGHAATRFAVRALAPLLALTFPLAVAQDKPAAASPLFVNAVEAALVRTFEQLSRQQIDSALKEIDTLLERNPNFRLGHLIKGDLLMARSGKPVAFGQEESSAAPFKHEARVRLDRYRSAPAPGHLPDALLEVSSRHKHVLLVDTERHRLYVFANENGRPRPVVDFYVSAGKKGDDKEREGDQRTPLGVYHVTSSVPREKLTDFYGSGAFPINYPNAWDKANGRNGSGIWLHGTPSDTYSRPPRASDGCVVLTNEDFQRLASFVDIGSTPVVLTSKVEWLTPERWQAERAAFASALEAWRKDWESRDVERYLEHYSERFVADGKGFNEWAERKRFVAAGKKHIKVDIEVIDGFAFRPTESSAAQMVVTYRQDYRSNNLNNKMNKRQVWSKENGRWKILFETAA